MYPLDPPNAITLGSIYVNLRLLYEESDYVLVRVRTNIGGSIGYAYNWSILMTKTVRVIRSMYLLGLSALNRSAPGRGDYISPLGHNAIAATFTQEHLICPLLLSAR